ncbi:MAG: hypothetical protein VX768_17970 [Planctomycetota bacterium]|nr:hypothetical protein [Planctomycetota bacterium]
MGGKAGESIQSEGRWKRGYWSLLIVQVQGAFSDSVFKFLVVFLITTAITGEVADEFGLPVEGVSAVPGEMTAEINRRRDPMITMIMMLFALPMILFVMSAGFLSDTRSKARIIFLTKVAEIGIMLLAAVFLYLQWMVGLLAVLFLMATQSSFFAPAKFGLMPEMLPSRHLSWANGIMAMGSFVLSFPVASWQDFCQLPWETRAPGLQVPGW